MNIQDMVKQANAGFLYNNRYEVTLMAPPSNKMSKWNDSERLDLISKNVSATALPGTEILTGEWQNKGPTLKVPYKRNYNDITLTIYNDADSFARVFFEDWFNCMYSLESYNWEYRNETVANMIIKSKDKYNNDVAAYTIYDAYPLSIEDMALDATDSEIQTVSVTMAYTNYTLEPAIK